MKVPLLSSVQRSHISSSVTVISSCACCCCDLELIANTAVGLVKSHSVTVRNLRGSNVRAAFVREGKFSCALRGSGVVDSLFVLFLSCMLEF